MHTLYGMLLMTFTCLTGPAIAPVLAANVESHIDSITIYPGHMAEIECIASIDLKTGQGDLVFADLPSSIVDGSIRVAVTDGDAMIGGVETAREPVGEPPRERERKLREAIDELTRDQQDALDRVAAANNEITFIEGLAELPSGAYYGTVSHQRARYGRTATIVSCARTVVDAALRSPAGYCRRRINPEPQRPRQPGDRRRLD